MNCWCSIPRPPPRAASSCGPVRKSARTILSICRPSGFNRQRLARQRECLWAGACHGPFRLKDGVLHAEDVPLPRIAEEVGTPVYIYSRATLARHARVFREALAGVDNPHIAFAVKAIPTCGAQDPQRGLWRRCRFGEPARAGSGHETRGYRFLGRRQDACRTGAGSRGGHRPVQHRERRGRLRVGRDCRTTRQARRLRAAGQPRCRCAHA